MGCEEAIGLMLEATDVNDWNKRRYLVKMSVNPAEQTKILAEIDCYGLINQVVKRKHYDTYTRKETTTKN